MTENSDGFSIADIPGLKAIEKGLKILKALQDGKSQLEQSQLKLKLAELMDVLVDTKTALTRSREEIVKLEDEIARLKDTKAKKIRPSHGQYLEVDEKGNAIDGPFCSRCADTGQRYIRVIENREKYGRGKGACPECKTVYDYYFAAKEINKNREASPAV